MSSVIQFPRPAVAPAPAPIDATLVDQLGVLQAQISDLSKIEAGLKDAIKTEACDHLKVGASVKVEGQYYSATIIEMAATQSLDPKLLEVKLKELLGDDHSFFTDPANFKTRAGSITLKLTARKTK